MKIVISMVVVMFLIGCSDDTKEDTKKILKDVQENIKEIKQEIKEHKEEVIEDVKDIKKEVKENLKEVKKEVSKHVEKVKPKVKKEETKKVVIVSTNGEQVFKKCVGCHGSNAEKKALNKSQIIKGWDKEKVISAIEGYKNGTYGSSMKGVMKSQVSKLNKNEIEAVSKYISNL